jgi:hypothetical protein
MNQKIFLLLLIILAVGLPLVFNVSSFIEGYSNYKTSQAMGEYPNAQTHVLVQDTYPPIGKNQISNDTSNDIWQSYPTFTLGSYEQITNNIRYPRNPDVGRCTPASMCGALYHEKDLGNNIITPLPPVSETGTRIGYFTTTYEQLVDSLPFTSDGPNILY